LIGIGVDSVGDGISISLFGKFNLNKYCKCDTEAVVKVYKSVDEFNSYYRTPKLRYKYMARLTKYIDESYYCDTADEVEAYEAKHGKIESPKINGIPLSEYDLDEKTNEPVLRKDSKYYKTPSKITPKNDNNNKWSTPSKKICESNGGKVDDNVHCTSNWDDAKKICKSINARLPTIVELESLVTSCGGNINQDNKDNLSYERCYKEKGFINDVDYWSSSSTEISHTPKLIHVSLGSKYSGGKLTLHSVMCHIK
jgi:hypothetical protein